MDNIMINGILCCTVWIVVILLIAFAPRFFNKKKSVTNNEVVAVYAEESDSWYDEESRIGHDKEHGYYFVMDYNDIPEEERQNLVATFKSAVSVYFGEDVDSLIEWSNRYR